MERQGFFQWWSGQLKELLPARLRRHLRSELSVLIVELRKQGVHVDALYQGDNTSFGLIDTTDPAPEQREALQEFIAALPHPPERILVRIRPGRYLRREIELPLAAEENLAEAIGFQMDSLTPFSADQVLYFCGVIKRINTEKKLRAWLVATPTQPVQQALELLGDAPPVPMQFPRQPPAPDAPLELAFKTDQGRAANRVGVPAFTILLLIGMLGGVAWMHVTNRIETRDHLALQLADVQEKATRAGRLQESIDAVREQSRDLRERRTGGPLHTALLNDITQRLGDDTWLQRLDIRDDKVVLQGISGSASNLIALLEASPFLGAVRFQSSVTRDRRYDGDRFSISARLKARDGDAS